MKRHHHFTEKRCHYFACMIGLMLVGAAYGQNADASTDEAAAEAVEVAPSVQSASPLPGPEVMRPTKHGFILSPKGIDVMAKQVTKHLSKEYKLTLTPGQEVKAQALAAKRIQDLQSRRGNEAARAWEVFFEHSVEAEHGEIKPEDARHLAEHIGPALSIQLEFFTGFRDDLRPILNDEQFKKLDEGINNEIRIHELRQQRLQRWAHGDISPKEQKDWTNVIEWGETWQEREARLATQPASSKTTMQKIKEEFGDEDTLRWLDDWSRFLPQAQRTFQFNDEQFKASRKILESYRDKVAAIMTDEWKQRYRRNCLKYGVLKRIDHKAAEIYRDSANREDEELKKPYYELERAFHRDVIALATETQRANAIAKMQKLGAAHGMTKDELALPAAILKTVPIAQSLAVPTEQPPSVSTDQPNELPSSQP